MAEVKRYLALNEEDDAFLQEILMGCKIVDFLTFREYQTLNSLRQKFNLPEVEGADEEAL